MGQSPWSAPPTHPLQISLDFILMFPIQSLKLMTMIFLWPFLCYICMLRILVLKDTRVDKIRESMIIQLLYSNLHDKDAD